MTDHLTAVRMAFITRELIANIRETVEKKVPSFTAGTATVENSMEAPQKIKNRVTT